MHRDNRGLVDQPEAIFGESLCKAHTLQNQQKLTASMYVELTLSFAVVCTKREKERERKRDTFFSEAQKPKQDKHTAT